MVYQERAYRNYIKAEDLVRFELVEKETDLLIQANVNLYDKAMGSVIKHRGALEQYIETNPKFLRSLSPVWVSFGSPQIIRLMAAAAKKMKVGPMAAVAGTIAEQVGRDLLPFTNELIIENGGDIFLASGRERIIGLRSRALSPFGIRIKPGDTPLGVCSSSSRLGHSVSFGKAELVTVISPDTALADCYATSIANRIHSQEDLMRVIDEWRNKPGLTGILAVQESKVAFAGKIDFVSLTSD